MAKLAAKFELILYRGNIVHSSHLNQLSFTEETEGDSGESDMGSEWNPHMNPQTSN